MSLPPDWRTALGAAIPPPWLAEAVGSPPAQPDPPTLSGATPAAALYVPVPGPQGIPGSGAIVYANHFPVTVSGPQNIHLGLMPVAGTVQWFINGILQHDTSDLTGGGDTYTFGGSWQLLTGDTISALYQH